MQRGTNAPVGYLAFLGRRAVGAGTASRSAGSAAIAREADTSPPTAASRGIGLGIVLGLIAWCIIITLVLIAI
jgi:hypothetical protein